MADWDRRAGFDLTGKRALVVGFGNPAGEGVAIALAEAGADVAVASATLDGDEVMAAKRAAKKVAALGRKSFSQGWDVTLPGNVQVGLRQIVKEIGKPEILVYNADHALLKPIEKVTDAEFGHTQAVNLSGAFYASRSFVRELGDAEGRIIFLTSMLGERGVEHAAAYGAARGGVVGLMANLSQELGARRITVNCISMGWMEWSAGGGPNDISANRLLRFIPLKRYGKAEDVALFAVLLASEGGAYLNGQVFHVDGGVLGHL
ncbi:MAG: SDR family NAD(P)-dependent oxidoreductase [Dehalococcoidia bacterium]